MNGCVKKCDWYVYHLLYDPSILQLLYIICNEAKDLPILTYLCYKGPNCIIPQEMNMLLFQRGYVVMVMVIVMMMLMVMECITQDGLTHWGRVMHICISKLTIIGPDNGLSPGRCQAIIWTNDGILLTGPLGTNFSEILIEIYIFSFKKMHLKMSSGNWRPFCLGLNVLTH